MQLPIYNQNGKKSTSKVEVSDAVFGTKINKSLLSQYVFVYLSNQREAVAHTKNRSDVSGGGKKPWAQKGTGRARAGSNRSPLWRKGGVTFGPTNERNWKKSLNKKMRKLAMCSALSMLAATEKLKVLDEIKIKTERMTKQANEIWQSFGSPRKLTLVVSGVEENLMAAFANLPQVTVKQVGEVSAYDVITGGEVVIMQSALDYAKNWEVTK